jgi:hypothetical protein
MAQRNPLREKTNLQGQPKAETILGHKERKIKVIILTGEGILKSGDRAKNQK